VKKKREERREKKRSRVAVKKLTKLVKRSATNFG